MSPQETYRIVVVVDTDAAKKNFAELARLANQTVSATAQLKNQARQVGRGTGRVASAEQEARKLEQIERRLQANLLQQRRTAALNTPQARSAHTNLLGSGNTDLVNVGSQVYFLKRALATIGIIGFAKQMIEMADAAKASQNRLRNLTSSAEELATVTARLRGISQETRTSFEGTSEIYSRMAFATQGLGYSQAQLLGVTKSLNQAVLVSGARSQEATSALIQFSQALGSNKLGGDEFRSVSEQLPYVMKIIADSLGVPIGRLKALAQEGKLTTKVLIDAFVNASDKIDAASKNVQPTIEQAFTTFKNGVLFFVADMDAATGASAGFSKAIMDLAKHIDFLGRAFATLLLTGAIGLAWSQISRLFIFLGGQLSLILNLTRAVAAQQITMGTAFSVFGGPIAAALLIAASALVVFSDKIMINQKQGTSLRDMWSAFGTVAWKSFQRATQGVTDFINQLKYAKSISDTIAGGLPGAAAVASHGTPLGPGEQGPLELPDLSMVQKLMVKAGELFDAPIDWATGLLNQWDLSLQAMLEKFVDFINKIALMNVSGMDRTALRLIGSLQDAIAKMSDEKTAKQITNPLVEAVANSLLLDQAKIKERENEYRGAGERLAEAAAAGFKGKDAGFFKKFMQDWSNTANLDEANRARQGGTANLTGHGATTPPAPTEDKLSKWDKYIEKLKDSLALLQFIGTEREKAVMSEELEARRTLGLKSTDVPTQQQQYRINQAGGLADEIFTLKGAQAVQENISKLIADGVDLRMLDTNQLEVQKALLEAEVANKDKLGIIDKDIIERTVRQNQYLARRKSLYEELVKPLEDLKQREIDLGAMFDEGILDAQQFAQQIRELHSNLSAMDNTIRGGLRNGLDRMREGANDLGQDISNFVVGGFDKVTNAIVRFTETGEIGFRTLIDLIHEMAAELIQLAAKQLFAQILGAGMPSLISAGAGGGYQPIGTTDSITNRSAGGRTVGTGMGPQSNQSQTQAATPVVNIYNILDPRDIPAALSTPAGRQAVLNVISRHPETVKKIIGTS